MLFMRIAAGVLQIISGIINILIFIGLLIASIFTISSITSWFNDIPYTDVNIAGVILVSLAVAFLVAGILSLIGGIFSLQRKHWGLALTGAIFTLFPSIILGILTIIFVSVTKHEFS
jgi:hypothetical protein